MLIKGTWYKFEDALWADMESDRPMVAVDHSKRPPHFFASGALVILKFASGNT
jgi:hypothetical protein